VTLTLVNLNPDHYITSHDVTWGEKIAYTSSDRPAVEALYPSISLHESEVYMNHKFTDARAKTVLCGFKFFDDRNGQMFMQDRAAWLKKYGEGEVIYFMPGHSAYDFENHNLSQMILNAINWKP
jgi:trehalose utilization protein